MLDSLRHFIRQRRSVELRARPLRVARATRSSSRRRRCCWSWRTPTGSSPLPERVHIEGALSRHFTLDLPGVHELLALASPSIISSSRG